MGLFDIPAESLRPDESEAGPLPPRSRSGLWWQFWFQWAYLLVGSVLILAVVGLLLWASAAGGSDVGGLGGGGGGSRIRIGGYVVLTRRQYRLERDGGRDAWAKRVQEALREGSERADKKRAAEAKSRAKAETKATAKGKQLEPAPVLSDQLELTPPVYRGAGFGLVEELAAPLGWELDWKRTRASKLETAYLTRRPSTGPAVA
ncbi:hypothetical protein GCM10010441_12970 [Kitasatospora paracochleata]|uniref:Uncharacterized protein n=1 Tax=Kitasatospora paracochleata TaxID=58354 RepID=A0ABT1JAX7_9ACTN|nr:hypothetical protein [Kitasatospora paracochleata]MCP2314601.1 hypothetical protein [Kitasatospora paracochleata]